MKSVYWRPQKMAATTTLAIGLGALVALALVEMLPRLSMSSYHDEQVRANQLAELCRERIAQARKSKGLPIHAKFDPLRSGLIGTVMTSITSKPANLRAKQLSLHPQFPALIVQMLKEAGVRNGDTVAVGWTGSFPAFNVALAAAMETMQLRPIIISSVTASQYGANEPEFVWLDMERELHTAGLIGFRTQAATIGGPGDCGKGMSQQSLDDARAAMRRNDVEFLATRRLSESIDKRMSWLQASSDGQPITAYVNVGGGVASCGGEKADFETGGNAVAADPTVDCMMQRFSARGIPVVHLAHPHQFASRHGLSESTESWQSSTVTIRADRAPSRILALLVLVLICLVLQAFVLKDVGYQLARDVMMILRRRPTLRIVGQKDGPQLMA
jgi:poly-gamma-glutamate system protein